MSKCPVVFCLDSKFVKLTRLAIDSLKRVSPDAEIVLVVPEILAEFSEEFPQLVIDQQELASTYTRDYDRVTKFTYARLFLPKLLQALDYDKCLYVDGDIIFNRDVTPLLEKDVPYLGMVKDGTPDWLLPGIEKDVYYNAGVILMNLKALREDNFTEKCLDYIKNHEETYVGRESTWLHDQTTINALYSDKITELEKEWNWQLSWNPPTKIEDVPVNEELNIHYLTDYNKPTLILNVLSHYKSFPSVRDDIIDVVMIVDKVKDANKIKESIQSVLNQTLNTFKLHVFIKSRDRYVDTMIKSLEDERLIVYDVSSASSVQEVYEYSKSKLQSDWILILDEDMLLRKSALFDLKFHWLRYKDEVIFGTCTLFGEYFETQIWPRMPDTRLESLFYSWVRDCCILCKRSQYVEFDFSKTNLYPHYELVNHLIAVNENYGATGPDVCLKRTDDFDRMRFYKNKSEITRMLVRSFKEYGVDLNLEQARYLNTYETFEGNESGLSDEDLHGLKVIRRKFETRALDQFNKDKFYELFKC